MPLLTNTSDDEQYLWDIEESIPAGASIHVSEAEAAVYADHPIIKVSAELVTGEAAGAAGPVTPSTSPTATVDPDSDGKVTPVTQPDPDTATGITDATAPPATEPAPTVDLPDAVETAAAVADGPGGDTTTNSEENVQ